MSKARQKRLQAAREWFPAQNFTEESHIVKVYRKRFNVDKACAMRELCMYIPAMLARTSLRRFAGPAWAGLGIGI